MEEERGLANRRLREWVEGDQGSWRGDDWLKERPSAADPAKGWDLTARAPWMAWMLNAATEYTLLSLRAHGSSLQRHRQSSRWNVLHYQELSCPLCIEEHAVHTPENNENLLTVRQSLEKARK